MARCPKCAGKTYKRSDKINCCKRCGPVWPPDKNIDVIRLRYKVMQEDLAKWHADLLATVKELSSTT